ncbi:MAG: hypothetical protein ACKVWV_01480 [Planctomycetota bacterium]
MKTFLLVFAVALLAVCGGAAGAFLLALTPSASQREVVLTPIEPVRVTPGASKADDPALRDELAALAAHVDRLEAEIVRLRDGSSRTPAIAPAATDALAESTPPRDAILEVIEQDRQERQRKQQEERDQREMTQLLARSERIAQEVGLDARQQKSLTDVLVLERQKIDEMRAQFRGDDGAPRDFEQAREQFQALRAWKTNELATRLGADVAKRIEEEDDARWRGAQRAFRGERRGDTAPAPDGG